VLTRQSDTVSESALLGIVGLLFLVMWSLVASLLSTYK
jgi:hypothetical protein